MQSKAEITPTVVSASAWQSRVFMPDNMPEIVLGAVLIPKEAGLVLDLDLKFRKPRNKNPKLR